MTRPSHKQLAMIHIAAKDLGLDEATYRAALKEITGRRSAGELNYVQASAVIAHFERRGWKPRKIKGQKAKGKRQKGRGEEPRFSDLGDRPGMASPAQLRMIEALWAELAVGDPGLTLRKFLMRVWKCSDLRFLTSRQAWEVTEAIKAMIRRRTGKSG